ncbi:tetratricopeptide repeat protein 21B-like [Diadema antillarum]|uniref:tetratricopeptide repeat protein 21B-like n=1 Tax=Diadema antillarum TaxID=105358 RepID=UPI003A8C805E
MADSDVSTLAAINFYCQEKLYRHVQRVALEAIKKYGSDPVLLFFKGYGLILEDRLSEGMRELESIRDKPDVILCSTMALIYAHKKSKNVDKEAVQELDAKMKDDRKRASDKAVYFAALFLWHTGRHDKAREYVDRSIKMAGGSSLDGSTLRGWIDLTSGRDNYLKKAGKFFEEVLSATPKAISALLGKARYMGMRHNYSGALELVNQAVVSYPGFMPALIEKMRLQLALQDWEQTVELAQRAIVQEPNCIEAIRLQVLQLLCKEGNYAEAAAKIGELIQVIDRFEPKNAHIYCHFAKTFARVCSRSPQILLQTMTMVERAISLDGNNADFYNESGYQQMMQGKNRDAVKAYRTAMKLDETSVVALTGIIRYQLHDGQLDDAEQQLDFLGEIQESIGKSSDILFLRALLSRKRNKSAETSLGLLNEASTVHFQSLKGLPLGSDYFTQMNPDFLVEMVKEYLLFAPTEPQSAGQPADPALARCNAVLDPVCKAVPGLLEGYYLQARVKFLLGQVEQAQASLQHCLDRNPEYSDAHLLMAQIYMHQGNYQQSSQSLEVGLSYNFEVREMPLYHLIKARTQKKMGEMEECCKTLQAAMALPGVKKRAVSASRRMKGGPISTTDRVSVFLELAEAYRETGAQHEAAKVMQDAINEFGGTPEEIRITIANADLSLARGDVEQALGMLRNITPEQSYFVKAREKMAEIYLNHRKDKRLYASCYRELAEKYPSSQTSILLGDAYMSIQEPEKAIEVYEKALKKNPRDSALASKIGQGLVKTHQYGRAINYYEAALKTGGQSFLRHDLGELLLKLRHYEKAEKTLKMALEHEPSNELSVLMDDAKLLLLLAKVHRKGNKIEDAMLALTKARDTQARVLKRVQVEQPDNVPEQKELATGICSQMAEQCTSQRDFDKAIKFYKEALVYSSHDAKAMLELARLYLAKSELDSCQHQLVQLLQADGDNDAALVMMADLMFRKGEYEQAMFHFQQLLERSPEHYDALARLVDLMRRAGKLEEVPHFLDQAEKASPRAAVDPGFNYCKGLYAWYIGNPNDALKHFNMARKDSDWGQRAIANMIEICINPDNETLGGETFENVDLDAATAAEKADSEQVAARTAEKLIKELKPKEGSDTHLMLEIYTLMANKTKANIEKALSAFMELVSSSERENVPALLGVATAYMMLKQTPRARNQLKRIAKMEWNPVDAEEFEKSWLLLSDVYINSGKFDMATELLKKCLKHNMSCCKAYEYLGFIMEKEQSYQDAANSYEKAWKYGNQHNPHIGYKLAFNYMKAKRFVDAIDICHKVLAFHPDYPRMRKDILDKARASIRA